MSKDKRSAAEEPTPVTKISTPITAPGANDAPEVQLQGQAPQSSITTRLKEAYRVQDTLPKLIDDESVREQSLEDYYIKLQIVLKEAAQKTAASSRFDSVSGDKQSIDMVDIFSQVDEDHPEAHKLLLLGGAGVGKSTLMHYMSYRWGKDDLWQDKYDAVFRVRLKNLLNEDWKDDYTSSAEWKQNKLACFVHSCLPRELQEGENEVTVAEIVGMLQADKGAKALLLLDGFDEVASKVVRTGSVPARIFKEVFECQNVVLTSRPNAVRDEFKKQFERTVENIGLDSEGIEQYIDNAFASKQQADGSSRGSVVAVEDSLVERQALAVQLKDFLMHNSTVNGICTIPINLALVCLIWKDSKEKLQSEEFNVSTLYNEVVVWLGKRHLKKFDDDYAADDLEAISGETIHESNEVKSLKQIAYRGFTESEALVLHGQNVETYAREAWSSSAIKTEKILEMVHKYGLIKSERDEKNLLQNEFSFIHLTFQEYLMSLRFREMLQLESSSTPISIHGQAQTMGDFLAEHRDDPRYLMTWKFLTAIIEEERVASSRAIESGHAASSHSLELEATQKATQELVTKFWEAMTCNVDGVVDLGMEQKIKLLLNLLGQVKNKSTDGKTMVKIPNLESMMDFVDGEILKDPSSFNYWTQEIVNSEYKSARLESHIEEVFADMESHHEVLASAFEVAGAMNYPAEKLNSLVQQVVDAGFAVGEEIAKQLEESSESVEEGNDKDTEEIEDNAQQQARIRTQKIILQHFPKLATQALPEELKEQILDFYVENLKSKQGDLELPSRLNMSRIGGIMGNANQLPNKIGEKLLSSEDSYVRYIGTTSIEECVKKGIVISSEVVADLAKLLSDEDSDVRCADATVIGECAKKGIVVALEVVADLAKLLSDEDNDVRCAGASAIVECAKKGIIISSEVVAELAKLLISEDFNTRSAGASAIGECAKLGVQIPSEVITRLPELLMIHETGSDSVKKGAWAIGECMKVSASDVLTELKKLLSSEDSHVSYSGALAIAECAKVNPLEVIAELARLFTSEALNEKGATAIGECAKKGIAIPSEVVAELQKMLGSENSDMRKAGASALRDCVLAGIAIPSEVVTELQKMLSSEDDEVRDVGAWAIIECVRAGIAIPSEVVTELQKMLGSELDHIRYVGATAIGECVRVGIANPSEVLAELQKMLSSENSDMRKAGASAIKEYVTAGVQNPLEILAELTKLFSDKDGGVRTLCAYVFGGCAKLEVQIPSKVIVELQKLLSSEDSPERCAGAWAIRECAKAGVQIPSEVIVELQKLLDSEEAWLARSSSAQAIGECARRGIAISSEVVTELLKLLSDEDSAMREAGAQTIGECAKGGITIPSEVIAELEKLLFDEDSIVREAGAKVIVECAKISPAEVLVVLPHLLFDEDDDVREAGANIYSGFLLSARENFLVDFANALKYLDQTNLEAKASIILALAKSFEEFNQSEEISNIGKIAKACLLLQHEKHITEAYELSSTIEMDDDDSGYEERVAQVKALEKLLTALPEVLMENIPDINDREEFIKFMRFIAAHLDLVLNNETREFFKLVYARVLEFEQNSLQQAGVGEDEGVEEVKEEEKDIDDADDTEALEVAAVMVDTHELSKSLILKFLEAGFTTSFNLPKCEIIVGGRHYKITDDRDELEDLCQKAVSAANDSGNPLARQIVEHQPLFGNSGSSVKPAASDVQHSVGVLSGDELDYSSYDVSMCVRSNHHQDLQGSFILLEQRLVTGEYVYRKIYTENGGVKVASQAVNPIDMEGNSGMAVRKAIFGEMSYYGASGSADAGGDVERPVYYTKTLRVSNEDAVISMYEALRDSAVSEEAADIFALFSSRVALGDDVAVISWEEFTKEGNSSNRNKAEILKLEGDALDQFKSDEAYFADHVKLDNLDREFRETILKDADILQQVIEDHKFAKAEKAEIASISANPYQDAFYKTLRMELNSSYLAATTIKSGWVKNDKKGDMGKFGSFMKEVSGVVPFVGPGVKIIGSVLKMADAKHQKSMIDNYATFVVDSSEMAQVAELIARRVVLSNLAIEEKGQSMKAKIKGWLANAAANFTTGDLKLLPKDLDDAVSMVQDTVVATVKDKVSEVTDVQGQAEEYIAGKKEELMEAASDRLAGIKGSSEASAKGKADAKIVAQMIAGKIFAGECKAGDLNTKADSISEFIRSEFGVMGTGLDANSTAETKTDAAAEPEAKAVNVKVALTDEEIARDIATSSLGRLKLLIKANKLESEDTETESTFISDFTNALVSDHGNLIESAKETPASMDKVVKQLAKILKASEVGVVTAGNKFELSTAFMEEDDFFDIILAKANATPTYPSTQVVESPGAPLTPSPDIMKTDHVVASDGEQIPAPGGCCAVSYVTSITHNKEILNHPKALKAAANRGITLDQLIELCSDDDIAEEIIASTGELEIEMMLGMLLGDYSTDGL